MSSKQKVKKNLVASQSQDKVREAENSQPREAESDEPLVQKVVQSESKENIFTTLR